MGFSGVFCLDEVEIVEKGLKKWIKSSWNSAGNILDTAHLSWSSMESWNGISKAGKGLQDDQIQPLIQHHLNQLNPSSKCHVQLLLEEFGVLEISWSAQKNPWICQKCLKEQGWSQECCKFSKKKPPKTTKKNFPVEDLGFRRCLKWTTFHGEPKGKSVAQIFPWESRDRARIHLQIHDQS